MPSISEILDSVSVPELIKDKFIKNGRFESSSRGLIHYSGGFTVVFPVYAKGKKWAFRCWHTEMGNVRKRFNIIANYINKLDSSYFCNFHYEDSGLTVDGKVFPTTRMDWVNGKTLNQYLKDNVNNKELLLALAEKFLIMTETLHKYHIAHGDLQHGNILVTETGDIKLVDYDSLFVPGLEGESDLITGKAEYQHPKRKVIKITSEKLDYFSELTIYLSILAIAHEPSLISKFSIDDSLLFQSTDWTNFESSHIYSALKNIPNNTISLLTGILRSYLSEDNINDLRPFTDIWRDIQKKPSLHRLVCGKVDGIVFRGISTLVAWEVENASEIFVNTKKIPSCQTSQEMTFMEDSELTLILKNGLHTLEYRKGVKVLDPPTIQFSVDKPKLKKTLKGTEPTSLKWNVSNAVSVELKCGTETLSTDLSNSNFVIRPQVDSEYALIVKGLDNSTVFTSSLQIIVRERAEISFKADKLFTLPSVPVTILWNVKKGENIKINNNSVDKKGQQTFLQDKDERYVLSCEDEFGDTSETIKVKMLPLPVIKSILVDTPNIDKDIRISYSTPRFPQLPIIPSIKTSFTHLDIPTIPDLKNSGFQVYLPKTVKTRFSQRIHNFLKNIFS